MIRRKQILAVVCCCFLLGFNSLPSYCQNTKQEIRSSGSLHVMGKAEITNIDQHSISLSWETNIPANSLVYLYDHASFSDTVTFWSASEQTTHHFQLDNLEPAVFYRVKMKGWNADQDTAWSEEQVITTASTSTGEIEVYFNQHVAIEFSTGSLPETQNGGDLLDTLVDLINQAQFSVDVALYSNGRDELIDALKQAVVRGVRVRYITDPEPSNNVLNGSLNFPVFFADGEGLMHHKFIIIDPLDTQNAAVWTGSTNFSTNQVFQDPNNSILIRDQALAKAYLIEFEEMWGGEGDAPDLFNSRRGSEKVDDTPHVFNIGGRMMELYFSPSDQTNDQLIRTVNTADHNLLAGLMLLTRMDLVEVITGRYQNGADTRVIINDLSTSSETYSYLQASGVPVVHHDPDEIFHHKYAIVDADHTLSDPVVITGSHNWSFSADTRNDENTLIIHDADVANIYRQEFEARWAELTSTSTVEINTTTPALFPNPVSSTFSLEGIYGTGEDYLLTICDIFGRTVWTYKGQVNPGILMHVESLAQGQYILTVTSPAGVAAIPFVKKR